MRLIASQIRDIGELTPLVRCDLDPLFRTKVKAFLVVEDQAGDVIQSGTQHGGKFGGMTL
jgi:hypothetical protein